MIVVFVNIIPKNNKKQDLNILLYGRIAISFFTSN